MTRILVGFSDRLAGPHSHQVNTGEPQLQLRNPGFLCGTQKAVRAVRAEWMWGERTPHPLRPSDHLCGRYTAVAGRPLEPAPWGGRRRLRQDPQWTRVSRPGYRHRSSSFWEHRERGPAGWRSANQGKWGDRTSWRHGSSRQEALLAVPLAPQRCS